MSISAIGEKQISSTKDSESTVSLKIKPILPDPVVTVLQTQATQSSSPPSSHLKLLTSNSLKSRTPLIDLALVTLQSKPTKQSSSPGSLVSTSVQLDTLTFPSIKSESSTPLTPLHFRPSFGLLPSNSLKSHTPTSDLTLETIKAQLAPRLLSSQCELLIPTSLKLATPSSPIIESSPSLASLDSLSPLRLTVHGQQVDQQAVENGTYRRFSQEELDARELTVNDKGQLMYLGKPLTTVGVLNYVMLPNGKFYAAYPKEGSCFHSTLVPSTCPGPLAAGTLFVVNGVLKKMEGRSGHFAPSPEAIRVAAHQLKKQGVSLEGVAIITKPTDGQMERSDFPSEFERAQKLKSILALKSQGEQVWKQKSSKKKRERPSLPLPSPRRARLPRGPSSRAVLSSQVSITTSDEADKTN